MHKFQNLDVRSVRGPLTRDYLISRGACVGEVYGDPALLLPYLFPEMIKDLKIKKRGILFVPNLHDFEMTANSSAEVLNPTCHWRDCIKAIVQSEYVISSSLHGVVVAEAFGIPARLVDSGTEPPFKYEDYFKGTGRSQTHSAATFRSAELEMQMVEPPQINLEGLLASFPSDLWKPRSTKYTLN
ncbi:polysaccharide pyruvyl transferase family protein [Arthrobacter sp. E3]|uniref:polysaccharide pyruvyl transferase family protein n=1 Tax=Arthrobacter sp. E3 TaxID=517402 RepID=UPI0032B3A0CC